MLPTQTYTGYECPNCKKIDRRELGICPHCGFPKGGTEEEKDDFYNKLEIVRHKLNIRKGDIFQARLSLFVIALINFAFAILYYLINREMEDAELVLIINILSAIVFMLLSFLAKEKPFTALAGGVVLYLALIVYHVVDQHPNALLSTFTRDIFVVWLIKGINGAREVEELQKELEKRSLK